MEIWLDTINIELIKKFTSIVNIAGVTTNPTILASSIGTDIDTLANNILQIQSGMLAIQVVARTMDEIIMQANNITTKFGNRVVIKIPANTAGYMAISHLSKNGVNTLATAVYEEKQVLLSSIAGSQYIAPYLSRINQQSSSGLDIIDGMLQIIKTNSYNSKLMIAAIKSVEQLVILSKMQAHAVTIPESVILELLADNHNTEQSIDEFDANFQKNQEMSESFFKNFAI